MRRSRPVQGLAHTIDRINEQLGRSVAWCTLAMVLSQALIVLLRHVFAIGSIPLQESVWHLHGLIFMLGAGYTLAHDGHVRIDIFHRDATPRAKALIDVLGVILFLLPVCVAVTIQSLPYVAASWRVLEGSSEASGLPFLFLLKSVIPVSFILLAVQGVSMLAKSLLVLSGRSLPPATRRPEVF